MLPRPAILLLTAALIALLVSASLVSAQGGQSVWLVIHTTTSHGNGAVVQSVRAVAQPSLPHCSRAIAQLAERPAQPGRNELRICTEQKPSWWLE